LAIALDESDRTAFDGQAELLIALTPDADGQPWDWTGRLGAWLTARLQAKGPALPTRPRDGALAVADVAQRLFGAYRVEGGGVHLAGCQLTDHPFLRLTYAPQNGLPVRHVFVAPDGSPVDRSLIEALGLDRLAAIAQRPPRIDEPALHALQAAGRKLAAELNFGPREAEPIVAAIAWVRHAEGRLQFTIGSATAQLPFSGWASLLQPRPFQSRTSAASSFHVAATDDGRIEPADQIQACQESGRRVLRQELATCSVTGRRLLEEYTALCPVTGLPTARDAFSSCDHCLQMVSRAALAEGRCTACRHLAAVRKDDPRLIWVFGEHRGLESWGHWRLAETAEVYVAEAASWSKRLLLVVDKDTLDVERLATAWRWASHWADVPRSGYADVLGQPSRSARS
jgi:hypothetical protein